MVTPVITALSSAFPQTVSQRALWDEFFAAHFKHNAIAKRLFDAVGVQQRHAVISPLDEDVSGWSTQKRMARYLPEAQPLSLEAVNGALAISGIDPMDVGCFVTTSCTGYVSPGLDAYIPSRTGMTTHVERIAIGHMGCYAALPGLATAANYVASQAKPAVVLSIELTSLHVQPSTTDTEQMVAHALFSDAAAVAVIEPDARGFEIVDVKSVMDIDNADLMTWQMTDLGFRMGLSEKIPNALAGQVRPLVESLLLGHDATVDDVVGWAVHPGGPRILDVVAEQLKLDDSSLEASTTVLRQHGNCSSATVLMVIEELQRSQSFERGDLVVAMAFGPGLTLYAVLLRFT